MIIYTSEAGNDGAGEYEERSCEQPIGDGRDREQVLLQSWARVEKPNLKTSVVLAPGCLSCLEYPADDHRVWVRVPVGKHRALAFP